MPPFMDLVRGWRWTIRCARSDGKAVEALTSLSPVLDPPYAAEEQAGLGRAAYRDFGKGNEHPAQLNFGDCVAYPLARATGEPLLFKGRDFTHTDVTPAMTTTE